MSDSITEHLLSSRWNRAFTLIGQASHLKNLIRLCRGLHFSAQDDELFRLAERGLPPLPEPAESGFVPADGARIWFASFSSGPAAILLHGGMGRVPATGPSEIRHSSLPRYSAITVDTRGHGRMHASARPFAYGQLAADVRAVMDHLDIPEPPSSAGATAPIPASSSPTKHPSASRASFLHLQRRSIRPEGIRLHANHPVASSITSARTTPLSPQRPGDFDSVFDHVGLNAPGRTAADGLAVFAFRPSASSVSDEFIKRERRIHRPLSRAQPSSPPQRQPLRALQRLKSSTAMRVPPQVLAWGLSANFRRGPMDQAAMHPSRRCTAAALIPDPWDGASAPSSWPRSASS